MNVGEFIKSKMHNMAVWIDAELHEDYISLIDARSELELTTLCAMLHSKKEMFKTDDWSALTALTENELALAPFVSIIDKVHERPCLHDKFWKYVRLFIDVMEVME